MRFRLKNMLAALGLAASLVTPALAQETFQPTANHGRRDPIPYAPYYPSAPADNSCPAPVPGAPTMPGTVPGTIPGAMPNAPGTNPAAPGAAPAPGPQAPAPNMMADNGAAPFGAAPSAGTGGGDTFNPSMFGDLLGSGFIRVATNKTTSSTNSFGTTSFRTTTTYRTIPVVTAGGFKISDNGSPRPQDRAYVTYNYYNDVGASTGGSSGDVNRETLGLEKTFLDGNASIGMRLPFTESSSSLGGFSDGCIGDLTLYGIYAIANNRDNGNILSTGMALTLPTGPSFRDPNGRDLNTFIYQPFIGYIYNFDRDFFIQGFHSAILSEHQNALSQDVAVGMFLFRNNDPGATIRGIVPTLEFHLYTPLDNTGSDVAVATPTAVGTSFGGYSLVSDNTLTITTGVTFLIGDRISLGVAVGIPVTGPRPDSYEAITTLNWRF